MSAANTCMQVISAILDASTIWNVRLTLMAFLFDVYIDTEMQIPGLYVPRTPAGDVEGDSIRRARVPSGASILKMRKGMRTHRVLVDVCHLTPLRSTLASATAGIERCPRMKEYLEWCVILLAGIARDEELTALMPTDAAVLRLDDDTLLVANSASVYNICQRQSGRPAAWQCLWRARTHSHTCLSGISFCALQVTAALLVAVPPLAAARGFPLLRRVLLPRQVHAQCVNQGVHQDCCVCV